MFFDPLNALQTGSSYPAVRDKDVFAQSINLPTLQEQHLIVSKLEELFSELDKGIEQLKTAQEQLKVYRQAVLKFAFEARLTNKNIKEGELPKRWKNSIISDICKSVEYGSAAKSMETGQVPVLRMGNIQNCCLADQFRTVCSVK